ncbi:MAG: alpha/beta fold hydrolase [Rhizobiaceae bacterium]
MLALILILLAGAFAWTSYEVSVLEARYPPNGTFVGPEGERTHFVEVSSNGAVDSTTILFIHGASGNLNDQMAAFASVMKDQARLIFVDRPGHGYSDRAGAETPAQQAQRYKFLLDQLGVNRVVVVGHSLGAASAAAFAVLYPEQTKGLVLLSPATHPWPTGVTWYYHLAAMPVIGNLFSETMVLPIGMLRLSSGAESVFAPQHMPQEYVENTRIALMLRPWIFRANARDVAGLNEFVQEFSPRYKEINAPTIIVTGDKDDIVSPSIHSLGLERDIKGSELIILQGVGHKPEYVANDIVVDAIQRVSK